MHAIEHGVLCRYDHHICNAANCVVPCFVACPPSSCLSALRAPRRPRTAHARCGHLWIPRPADKQGLHTVSITTRRLGMSAATKYAVKDDGLCAELMPLSLRRTQQHQAVLAAAPQPWQRAQCRGLHAGSVQTTAARCAGPDTVCQAHLVASAGHVGACRKLASSACRARPPRAHAH